MRGAQIARRGNLYKARNAPFYIEIASSLTAFAPRNDLQRYLPTPGTGD
ncbi:MAG: hypothetical protein LBL66_03930 [Clostridiales bacterium]|nr:hypothetical protein [Clostridiales bacterium]